jgi:hypothetical protein
MNKSTCDNIANDSMIYMDLDIGLLPSKFALFQRPLRLLRRLRNLTLESRLTSGK